MAGPGHKRKFANGWYRAVHRVDSSPKVSSILVKGAVTTYSY